MPLDPATPELIAALSDRLPEGRVGEPPASYLEEPRGRYHSTATALVRPATTEEVAETVRFAAEHRVGIVPYAGGTGLVGGQTPTGVPTLLLSVERLNRIRDIDADDNVLVAEAGVILQDAQEAAEKVDRLFPLSLASEGSARIGGLLGTNAGGVQVLRYGNARELCLGVEAVLPDGSILHGLKRLRKDNTGYDLRNLLIGSEGSLGIITAASLRLFPRPVDSMTALVATPDPATALKLLNLMRKRLGESLSAFELIHRQGFDFLAEKIPDTPRPFAEPPEWAVLLEATAGEGAEIAARGQAALEAAFEVELIEDALIAQNSQQAASFWEVRERIPEGNRLVGAIASHDISVPISKVPEFIDRGATELHRIDPDFRINCFGHLGDGNLHYNVFPPVGRSRGEYDDQRRAVTDCVHELAHSLGGSVSAEHGIGRLKTGDLERFGDPAKLAAMRAIKAALDPLGIMNPGAVLAAS